MAATLSIIIPVYNAAKTLDRCLDSLTVIAAGNRPNVEVVLINDGSTDDSYEQIQKWRSQLSGFRFVFLDQQNAGVSAARNHGLRESRGTWILFLDADDELKSDPLHWLESEHAATALLCSVERRWANGKVRHWQSVGIRSDQFFEIFTARNPVVICSLVFRRSAMRAFFDESLAYLEDWQFWLDNPGIFTAVKRIDATVLSVVHIHGANRTAQYQQTGTSRASIARRMQNRFRGLLSPKAQRNLCLQAAIGDLQAGRGTSIRNLFCLPCSTRLYVRLLAYFLLRKYACHLAPY